MRFSGSSSPSAETARARPRLLTCLANERRFRAHHFFGEPRAATLASSRVIRVAVLPYIAFFIIICPRSVPCDAAVGEPAACRPPWPTLVHRSLLPNA